jgi:hypothetical protein
MSRKDQSDETAAGRELEAPKPPCCSFYLAESTSGKIKNQKPKTTKPVTHVPGRKCNLCIGTYTKPSNGVHLARDFFVFLVFSVLATKGLAASFFNSLFI